MPTVKKISGRPLRVIELLELFSELTPDERREMLQLMGAYNAVSKGKATRQQKGLIARARREIASAAKVAHH